MDKLQPRLQKAVDMGISGLDIIHGELKDMMLEAEQELERAQKEEDESENRIDDITEPDDERRLLSQGDPISEI